MFDFWACLTFECRRFRKAEEGEEEVRLPSVAQTALLWGESNLDRMRKWGGLMGLIWGAHSSFEFKFRVQVSSSRLGV